MKNEFLPADKVASFRTDSEEFRKYEMKGTEISVCIGPALVPFAVDPLNSNEVRWQGKVVGYITGYRNEGNSLMADIVLTDPKAIEQVTKTNPLEISVQRELDTPTP